MLSERPLKIIKRLAVIPQGEKGFLFKLNTFIRSNRKTFGLLAPERSPFNRRLCETFMMYMKTGKNYELQLHKRRLGFLSLALF